MSDIDITPTELIAAAWSRFTEFYLRDLRVSRADNKDVQEWHSRRIQTITEFYKGNWKTAYPNEASKIDLPKIQNLVQTAADDLARQVTREQAGIDVPSRGAKAEDGLQAKTVGSALQTYWDRAGAEAKKPYLQHDLNLTGTAFLACAHPNTPDGWPKAIRLDPRGCYPDVVDDKLVDLMVVQRMRARVAAEEPYSIDLTDSKGVPITLSSFKLKPGDASDIEIVDYYCTYGLMRVVTAISSGQPIGTPVLAYKTAYPGLCAPPVGFAVLPTGDGQFRGHFDQVVGSLLAANNIIELVNDYVDQAIYAPWLENSVENWGDQPGPNTVYHATEKEAYMRRVEPAISNPQVFQVLENLVSAARGGASRPEAVDGRADNSIVSGSFLAAASAPTANMLSFDLDLHARIQQGWLEAAGPIMAHLGNTERPLNRPVGDRYMFTPDEVKDSPFTVSYAAVAGMDRVNRQAVLQNEVEAGFVSRETGSSLTLSRVDAEQERVRIEREKVSQAVLDKLIQGDDPDTLLDIHMRMVAKGEDFDTAAAAVRKEKMEAQQAAQTPETPGQPQLGAGGPPPASAGAPPAPPPAESPPAFAPSMPFASVAA